LQRITRFFTLKMRRNERKFSMLMHISTASPPYVVQQHRAAEELKRRMGERPAVARMIDAAAARSGIETRYVVVPDAEPSVPLRFFPVDPNAPAPGTKQRMLLYKEWANKLSVAAVTDVLQATGFAPSSIDRLVTVSCTGFSAPNFDYHLLTTLGFSPDIQRAHIGFMGCAAALVGFTSVLDSLAGSGKESRTTLLVSVELCSLHLQTEPSRDNILANMIFADGCGAALFSTEASVPAKARLVRTFSHVFPSSAEFMGWEIGDTGFEMMLSSQLPEIIAQQAAPVAQQVIERMGLEPRQIRHWALHPGGRAIIDALQTGLHLSDEQTEPSRAVLRQYGNMSSASILFVLKEIFSRTRLEPDEWLCAIAFGPGLSMEMAFLKGV
jgi:predicted naringenin-chalcone synthase